MSPQGAAVQWVRGGSAALEAEEPKGRSGGGGGAGQAEPPPPSKTPEHISEHPGPEAGGDPAHSKAIFLQEKAFFWGGGGGKKSTFHGQGLGGGGPREHNPTQPGRGGGAWAKGWGGGGALGLGGGRAGHRVLLLGGRGAQGSGARGCGRAVGGCWVKGVWGQDTGSWSGEGCWFWEQHILMGWGGARVLRCRGCVGEGGGQGFFFFASENV